MLGVVEGFSAIVVVVALGAVLAHGGLLDQAAQRVLSRVAFYVANPALLVSVLSTADVSGLFSGLTVALVCSITVTGLVYVLVARFVLHRDTISGVIGTMSTTYVNAGNLGIPVATYVLGDAALIAPVMLLQMLVLQPIALALMDSAAATRRVSLLRTLTTPVRNPVTVAALLGLALGLADATLPTPLAAPVELVGGMAVPAMLLAFGISLQAGPRPGRGTSVPELVLIGVLKTVVQPALAFAVARWALDLSTAETFAVTVISALPAAQNVFVIAARYEHEPALLLARDAISVTTFASGPVIVLVAALFL